MAGIAPAVVNVPLSLRYCSTFKSASWLRSSRAGSLQQGSIGLRVRAVQEKVEECNEEECAPVKEVGSVSIGWKVEDKTKVTGTFPPTGRKWTGYVEKDTAGQTNIYAVEPTVYVADNALSSGTAGTSVEGSTQNLRFVLFLGLFAVASASTILLTVGKGSTVSVDRPYSGPPLSFYIEKFTPSAVVEASLPAAPDLTTESNSVPSTSVEVAFDTPAAED